MCKSYRLLLTNEKEAHPLHSIKSFEYSFHDTGYLTIYLKKDEYPPLTIAKIKCAPERVEKTVNDILDCIIQSDTKIISRKFLEEKFGKE